MFIRSQNGDFNLKTLENFLILPAGRLACTMRHCCDDAVWILYFSPLMVRQEDTFGYRIIPYRFTVATKLEDYSTRKL